MQVLTNYLTLLSQGMFELFPQNKTLTLLLLLLSYRIFPLTEPTHSLILPNVIHHALPKRVSTNTYRTYLKTNNIYPMFTLKPITYLRCLY